MSKLGHVSLGEQVLAHSRTRMPMPDHPRHGKTPSNYEREGEGGWQESLAWGTYVATGTPLA